MKFPYGKAPFIILIIAIVTGIVNLVINLSNKTKKADIVFALFAPNHVDAYTPVIKAFEKKHNIKIQLQLVTATALQSRLQTALMTGADVPDIVEIISGSIGYFTKGPLKDVGFVDLTERLHKEGFYDRMVKSRFDMWSSRGRIFAIPHDVHPVMLCYRRDLIKKLGIDVDKLKTWDDFVFMGRKVSKDIDGDGNIDRYALDLPFAGDMLPQLILQRGESLFDSSGKVAFDSEIVADVVIWYIMQTRSEKRIAYDAGWGQPLTKAMYDGLVLFYFCPDWRTKVFQMDAAGLKGKMALIPLPAWSPGGRRTTTWGGTGLAITKASKKQELAWELAKELYFKKDDQGKRFAASNIIPPLKDAWDLPEFKQKNDFYSNQPIGTLYANLAPETPPDYVTPYTELAQSKLNEAFINSADYFEKYGNKGLRDYTLKELKRCADYVRKVMKRNAFLISGDKQ